MECFLVLDNVVQAGPSGEREANDSVRLAWYVSQWRIELAVDGVWGCSPFCQCHPWAGDPGLYKSARWEVTKNKPESRVPLCLCLQFLCPGSHGPDFPSQWPAMGTCKTQAFLLTLRWVMVFYHSRRKQARRMRQGCYHCQMLTFGESVRKTHRGEQMYWCYIFAQTITLKNERQNK